MRSIGGAELAAVQRCRYATWESIMGKSAKTGIAKRLLRPISAGNAKVGRKKPRQTAKSTPPPGADVATRTEGKQQRVAGGSLGQSAPAPVRADSKLGKMIALLRRQDGAPIAQMMKVTGWQAHSVRGAMSGMIKKRLGLTITSTKLGASRTYRIADDRR
jgi:hypothetical protein